MDRLVVTGTGTSSTQMALGFGRTLAIMNLGLTKLSSLGVATDSGFSPVKPFKLGRDGVCRCSRHEEVKIEAGQTLVVFREQRPKKRSKREKKPVHPPAAVSNPSNTVTFAEEHRDLANAAATLEQVYREISTAVLEAAYEKPAVEPRIFHRATATQILHISDDDVASTRKAPNPHSGDAAYFLENSEALNGEVISDDRNHILPRRTEAVNAVRNLRKVGRRLNLNSRIALKRTRKDRAANPNVVKANDLDTNSRPIFSGIEKSDLCSEEVDQMIKKYGNTLDIIAVKWDRLPHALLTAQDEIRLSNLFKPFMQLKMIWLALKDYLGREPLEDEWAKAASVDLQTLRRYLQMGRAARNKIIQHNLRLVAHQAHKYYKGEMSLSLFDLCQEGVQGLVRAIEKFDPKKGVRFSTYAVYWIRNGILRAQTRLGHFLRTPYNVAAHRINIRNASMDLTMKLEREPTDEEIRQHVGLTAKRYHHILKTSVRAGSLHERSRITGEEHIQGVSEPDDAETQFLKSTAGAILRFGMDDVLDSLKTKESLVIRQRYGLDGKGERSFGEIGRNLNLSREMVRKYEIRGILKLRHPRRLKYLRGFIL